MKIKSFFPAVLFFALIAIMMGCEEEIYPEPTPLPVPALSFDSITFSNLQAYFATNGSLQYPVDSIQAKTMSEKIDLTFIYNYKDSLPGFFDPVARSQKWDWDTTYYQPWLSTSVETRFYTTDLTKLEFDQATKNQAKIATFFSKSLTVPAPHGIFPTGSCIGGRQTTNPSSVVLEMGKVYGFKNTETGKRGLIYIRTDQSLGWPKPVWDYNTKVDIIREAN